MDGGWRRGAVCALFALACLWGTAGAARADDQIDAGPSPVLYVMLTSGRLTVQTADQPQVTVASQGLVDVKHVDAAQFAPRMPHQIQIASQTVNSANGLVTLPAETFVLPQDGGGSHEAVIARGEGDTVITVPRGTSLVYARVQRGRIALENYQGSFVAQVRTGAVALNHVNGSGFAEVMRGPLVANDSNFARVRVRTATGNMIFRGCTSNQIEATSTYGSIVYDNGRFQPGLAHFESEHGNIALGVRDGSGVQIGAHSDSGRVVPSFQRGAQVNGSAKDTQATVRGGGPIVTTTTRSGSIYLYNGSMRTNPNVRQDLIQGRPGGSPAMRANQLLFPLRNAPQAPRAQRETAPRQAPPPPRRHPPFRP